MYNCANESESDERQYRELPMKLLHNTVHQWREIMAGIIKSVLAKVTRKFLV